MKGRILLSVSVLSAIIASVAVNAAPIADKPLFMGTAVKPNLLFTIDDSGSMDSEILINTNDGSLWFRNDLGSFINDDGSFVFKGDRIRYGYLFPNGYNVPYDGSRVRSDIHPVPPIKPYAFIRSPHYNFAYYDPTVTYEPWPTYGGFSFTDVDPTAAPWDPVFREDTFTVDLTNTLSSSSGNWLFLIGYNNMVCDDFGSTPSSNNGACSINFKAYDYFPATYYVIDTTSTYTYRKDSTDPNSYQLDSNQSIILESVDADLTAPMQLYDANSIHAERASQNDYIGTPVGNNSTSLPPTGADATFTFQQSGTVKIWIRRLMANDSQDALWLNLENHDATQITTTDITPWSSVSGEAWNHWNEGHANLPNRYESSWQWEQWAEVNLVGNDHTLRIRNSESGSLIDQVLITTNTQLTPKGPVEYNQGQLNEQRECSGQLKPQHYQEFIADPTRFTGIDAIGPDGSCLRKIEIRPSTASFPSGRSYSEEIQNFANWFTYYRKRHLAMRGGLARAMNGMTGIRTDILHINQRDANRNMLDVNMQDFDISQDSFLEKNYKNVGSTETPLREALNHAGEQYMRTDADAPVTDACQRNYTLLFTDGYTSDTNFVSVGQTDGAAGTPFADGYSNTLGDIAHFYYETNIRPDLPAGQIPMNNACRQPGASPVLDCNADLHMTTFTVGLGTYGSIFGVTHQNVQDAVDIPLSWPNVNASQDLTQVDDLYHAAVNGRGEIFNAKNTAELSDVLSRAIEQMIQEAGSSSSAAVNSNVLGDESLAYSASFDALEWSGNIQALSLNPTTGEPETVIWDAAEQLNRQSPNSRTILTYSNAGASNLYDGVAFTWDNLSQAQQDDLNQSPSGVIDTLGESRLAFIRGDRGLEGSEFRVRSSLLGDITNSSPVFVGAPQQAWPDEEPFGSANKRYSEFMASNLNRQPMIYVGANDGMLHGFDASAAGGQEKIAYIPESVFSTESKRGLHYLTNPNYDHQSYVDLSPAVADVFIKTAPTGIENWRTILIGGLRGGGKGIFALDITDPEQFSEATASEVVLWEFSEKHDSDMGNLIHQPTVAMMNNNQWAVIFGNGYNAGSTNLFILFIESGLDGWQVGDYVKIPTSSTTGLSAPAVADLDGDKKADRIYAGDLEGNLWVFDVSSSDESQWQLANFAQGTPGLPLFKAEINNTAQPITAPPKLMRNLTQASSSDNAPNIIAVFGTGKYFSPSDPTSSAAQSFYGVWDAGKNGLSRDALISRSITESSDIRNVAGIEIDWANHSGYYLDLPSSGERVVTSPYIIQDIVFFNTMMPNPSRCEAGGKGWLMSIDAITGKDPKQPAYDTNEDGIVDTNDTVNSGRLVDVGIPSTSAFMEGVQLTATTEGELLNHTILSNESGREGRLGWVEKFKRQ
ncbi:MAG: PilC/PilY family type IV pilus protein [Pseudomonadota bacterium]